jgi:hypothetical protein
MRWAAAVLVLGVGCRSRPGAATCADEGTPTPGSMSITGTTVTCTSTSLALRVESAGRGGMVLWDVIATGGDPDAVVHDRFYLYGVTYTDLAGPTSAWQDYVTAGIGADDGLDSGATTLTCSDFGSDAVLTSFVRLYEDVDGELADCIVFGADPCGLRDGTYDDRVTYPFTSQDVAERAECRIQ